MSEKKYKIKEKRIINGVVKYRCNKCGYWLKEDEFVKKSCASNGLSNICKCCKKSYVKKPNSNSGLIGLYLWNCEHCKKDFTSKSPVAVFCSKSCRQKDFYRKNKNKDTKSNTN